MIIDNMIAGHKLPGDWEERADGEQDYKDKHVHFRLAAAGPGWTLLRLEERKSRSVGRYLERVYLGWYADLARAKKEACFLHRILSQDLGTWH